MNKERYEENKDQFIPITQSLTFQNYVHTLKSK